MKETLFARIFGSGEKKAAEPRVETRKSETVAEYSHSVLVKHVRSLTETALCQLTSMQIDRYAGWQMNFMHWARMAPKMYATLRALDSVLEEMEGERTDCINCAVFANSEERFVSILEKIEKRCAEINERSFQDVIPDFSSYGRGGSL